MKTVSIYFLSHPITNEIRYIGKTNNLQKRLTQHFFPKNLKKITPKNGWFKSLMKIGLKPTINLLDEVPSTEWQFWEQHYISLFLSWGFKLTNATTGGEGISLGYKFSETTRKNMSLSKLGKTFTEEHRKNISKSNEGNKNFLNHKHSIKSIEKIRTSNLGKNKGKVAWNKGLKTPQKVKDKLSKSRIGIEPWNKGKKIK